MSNPPENLQNPEDKSWLDQYMIDKVLRDNKLVSFDLKIINY
jgi:hypothetical protein